MNKTQIYQRFSTLGKAMLIPSVIMIIFLLYTIVTSIISYYKAVARRANMSSNRQHLNFDEVYIIISILATILLIYFSGILYNGIKFMKADNIEYLNKSFKILNIYFTITFLSLITITLIILINFL